MERESPGAVGSMLMLDRKNDAVGKKEPGIAVRRGGCFCRALNKEQKCEGSVGARGLGCNRLQVIVYALAQK